MPVFSSVLTTCVPWASSSGAFYEALFVKGCLLASTAFLFATSSRCSLGLVARFASVGGSRSAPTTFYPWRARRLASPDAACANAAGRNRLEDDQSASTVAHSDPRLQRASSQPCLSSRSFRFLAVRCRYAAWTFSVAPSMAWSNSTKRHSATSSLRASATMPTRRLRLPTPAKSMNHLVSSLPGW